MGVEMDRRIPFRVAVFTSSSSSSTGFLLGVCAGVGAGLEASPSARRVALTTCVANVAFSFADNPPLQSELKFFDVALDFGREALEAVREFSVVEAVAVVVVEASSRGRSSVLIRAAVAGVHVETLETALRTVSACACMISIRE